MKALRRCRICGFEAYIEEDLERLIKDKRCPQGRQNICRSCWNEYNAQWKKTNNYRVVNTKVRLNILNGFENPLLCHFCDNIITKIQGQNKDSLALHSLDGNHHNWNPSNKVPAHSGCHASHHGATRAGRKNTPQTKQKISEALTGRKLTEEHKKNISISLRGEKHYNWKGNKAKPRSIRHRNWLKKRRESNVA